MQLDPNLRETQLVLAVKGLETGRIRVADWKLNGETVSFDRIEWSEQRASNQLVTPVYPPHELFLRTHLSGRKASVVVDLTADHTRTRGRRGSLAVRPRSGREAGQGKAYFRIRVAAPLLDIGDTLG